MLHSHAASYFSSSEVENGILTGSTSVVTDDTASGGKSIVFGSQNDLRTTYRRLVISGTRTVYVEASGGADTNDGTSLGQAYATVQHAVDVSQPGDRILVGGGTYGYLSLYGKHGDAQHWLSIESQSGSIRPIISVADNSGNDGIDVQQSSYFGLFGFEIKGLQTSASTNPSGIAIFRSSDHDYIWNNLIHDFPGGGINCFHVDSQAYNGQQLPAGGWDQLDISFNTIHATSRYSAQNTSGISFYGGVDTTHATVDGHYGYRAIGNYIYDVLVTVNSASGQGSYPFVTDGNGISVDSLSKPWDSSVVPYTKPGLLEANVIVGVGGRAIHVFNSINVDGFYNTVVGNLRTNSPAINNGVELDSNIDGGHVHYDGNIIFPLNTLNSTDTTSTYTNNVILGGSQPVSNSNLDQRAKGTHDFATPLTSANIVSGLPVKDYLPLQPVILTRQATSTGYQALDSGNIRSGVNIDAGALSP